MEKRTCFICGSQNTEKFKILKSNGEIGLTGTRCHDCRHIASYLIDMEHIPVSFPKLPDKDLNKNSKQKNINNQKSYRKHGRR